jgi:hypothetical protein
VPCVTSFGIVGRGSAEKRPGLLEESVVELPVAKQIKVPQHLHTQQFRARRTRRTRIRHARRTRGGGAHGQVGGQIGVVEQPAGEVGGEAAMSGVDGLLHGAQVEAIDPREGHQARGEQPRVVPPPLVSA